MKHGFHSVCSLDASRDVFSDLGHVNVGPCDVGQLCARLNLDLGEVVVVVAGGHHVETHQDVEGQREHRQVPATVDRRQSAGHNRAVNRTQTISFPLNSGAP